MCKVAVSNVVLYEIASSWWAGFVFWDSKIVPWYFAWKVHRKLKRYHRHEEWAMREGLR